MKIKVVFLLLMISCTLAHSQYSFKAILKDTKSKEPLVGASAMLKGSNKGASSDVNGLLEIVDIPAGSQFITFSFLGYESRTDTFLFPVTTVMPIEILLTANGEELEEITISTTRSSRTIADEPTRMEAITEEELDEKSNMKPGDIRMLLSESTGIQTQQTSATTANSSIRIQGLDGRYTQILKDGFPLYSGFAGGLSIMQIAPLDLQQVEVIKGSASTLYGGGAIAGLVNLVSKVPTEERQLNFHVNGTSAGGLDVNAFYGQRFKKLGLTIFAARNSSLAYDPADIDLSAIPKFERYTFNPKLFIYFNEHTFMSMGMNAGMEDRLGGDMHYIQGKGDSIHSYYEMNASKRISTQLSLEHRFGKCSHLTIKNSLSYFKRDIRVPTYSFKGTQHASFTEVAYANHAEKSEWIAGFNLWTDNFTENTQINVVARDYALHTYGAFLQHTWNSVQWISLQTGIRTDYVTEYGIAVLPRVSLLVKLNSKFSSRIGGSMGYKAPSLFTEQVEAIQFQNVVAIDVANTQLETSVGGNFDVNYQTGLFDDNVFFSINQLFFYTKLSNPLVLATDSTAYLSLQNANGYMDTKGIETNIKITFLDFKLFLGYTYTDAKQHYNGILSDFPLTAKHRINQVLMYEVEDKWRIGLEAYYFGKQKLNDGATGKEYWICGFMVEKIWEKFSVYINFENFLDARQTRFDSVYTGSITNPVFRDIYAPMDGFVFNGGIKLKL